MTSPLTTAQTNEMLALADDLIQQAKNRTDHFRPKTYKVTLEYRAAQELRRLAATTSARDVREALELLVLQQRARARAFRLLDGSRTVSDPATLAKAEAYEECGNELKSVLSSGAVRIDASEQEAESAIRHLKIVIDAAENSNQSGENAVVRAAIVTGWKRS